MRAWLVAAALGDVLQGQKRAQKPLVASAGGTRQGPDRPGARDLLLQAQSPSHLSRT